jgi:hypothetical protein
VSYLFHTESAEDTESDENGRVVFGTVQTPSSHSISVFSVLSV